MKEEELFREHLEKTVRAARCNHNYITEDEIRDNFGAMTLKEKEFRMISEYLVTMGIKIGIYEESSEQECNLDREDISFLQMYLDDLKELPKHSEEEKKSIVIEAMKGDEKSREALIQMYLPEVVDIAKLYVGQGVTLEDLISEGNVGLMLGIEILNCVETPEEVMGHLGKMIMDAMDAAISDGNEMLVFEQKYLEKIEEISKKAKELSEDLRQDVTPEEVAKEMNLPVEDILEAMELTGDAIEGIVKTKKEE